jgi:hypothetical protein
MTVTDTTNVVFEDAMYVASLTTGYQSRVIVLYDAIKSDTLAGGAHTDHKRVYKLRPHEPYYLVDNVKNTDFPLVIVVDAVPVDYYHRVIQLDSIRPAGIASSRAEQIG